MYILIFTSIVFRTSSGYVQTQTTNPTQKSSTIPNIILTGSQLFIFEKYSF